MPSQSVTNGVTRRAALGAGGALLTLTAATACDLLSTNPQGEGTGSAGTRGPKGKQAPALAQEVDAGTLPPLAKRLPDEPAVVEPVDAIGVYGGEWRTALLGPSDDAWMYRTIGYEQLMRWTSDFSEPVPNIAASVEMDGEGREYTFHLRKGLRWSDGTPFTADDLVFAYEDILSDPDIDEAIPSFMIVDDQPAKLERIDDYTVRFTLAGSTGLFLHNFAAPDARPLIAPRHYLEKFHQKYNERVDELALDRDFNSWVDLFLAEADKWRNPKLPTLNAWQLTSGLGEAAQVVAERNPYYWKTDPEGSQLPYLDRVVYDVVNDEEVILLKISNGEIDLHTRHITTLVNKPVLANGREEGGYRFLDLTPGSMNYLIVSLNLTHKDPQKRAIFQNKDFRIGLSHAINREELIASVFQRQGEPWQACPREDSGLYDEELAKQFTEFDVDLANEYLDRAGYTERDGDDFRLGPDGQRISFDVELALGYDPTWVDGMDLISGYWQAVGIDAGVKPEERSLFTERKEANDHDATVWSGNQGALDDAFLAPLWYFPFSNTDQAYGIPWANWYTGQPGPKEQPPEPARRQMDLYDRLTESPDEDERRSLLLEILGIAKEEFYVIGTVLPTSDYGIVNRNLRNVVEPMPQLWVYPTPAPSRPERYFFDQPDE